MPLNKAQSLLVPPAYFLFLKEVGSSKDCISGHTQAESKTGDSKCSGPHFSWSPFRRIWPSHLLSLSSFSLFHQKINTNNIYKTPQIMFFGGQIIFYNCRVLYNWGNENTNLVISYIGHSMHTKFNNEERRGWSWSVGRLQATTVKRQQLSHHSCNITELCHQSLKSITVGSTQLRSHLSLCPITIWRPKDKKCG